MSEESFADMAARKREKLSVLMEAPTEEREAVLKANAAVAVRYFATPEDENELAHWRVLKIATCQLLTWHCKRGDF